jgi:hypothetical protein
MPTLAEAFVDIIGRDTGLAKAMGKAEKDVNSSTAKMQARLHQFGNGMKAIGSKMSLALTAPIVAMATISVKAFAEEEDALNRLQAALANTGSVTDGAMERYRAFASEVQKATVYGDELIIGTMAYGHNLGIQASQLEDAAKAAAGLAAKYRLDLQTAMMLLGRASQGNTMMLKRYGITLDDTLTPQEKFNQLLKIGASNFGLAEAEARTTSGQLKQLKNQFGDLQEEIGAALAPMLKRLVADLKSLVGWFQGLSTETKNNIVKVGLLVAAIGPLLVVIGQMALGLGALPGVIRAVGASLLWLNANPIMAAITALGLLAVGIYAVVKAQKSEAEQGVDNARAYKENAEKAKTLAEEYEALRAKANKTNAEQAQMNSLLAQIQTLAPEFVKGGQLIEGALDGISKKAVAANEAMRQWQMFEAAQLIAEAQKELKKVQDLQKFWGDLGIKSSAPIMQNWKGRELKALADIAGAQAKLDALKNPKAATGTAGGGDADTGASTPQTGTSDLVTNTEQWLKNEKERIWAAARKMVQTRKSAWEQVLSMSESFTVRMTELAQGETAARMKAIDLETAKRREAIEKGIRDETRKAMLLKALDMDVAAQKQALTDEEARKANEQAKADADAKRNRIGFAGSLGDVWRSAMTAGARLGVPDAPAVQTAKYSKEQVDLLKQIAEYTQGQLDLAKTNVNKLSAAEALL